MIKRKLLECNRIERAEEEVTARAGLIMFDGFTKAMKMDKIVDNHMPVPGSNRGHGGMGIYKAVESNAIWRRQTHSGFKGTQRR
jgi:hypothetical protein